MCLRTFAKGWRRVRDTCDDLATVWGGILSHKCFEHVKNFREPFTTSLRRMQGFGNAMRRFHDCLARTLVNESKKKLILFHKQDLLKKQIHMFKPNEIFDSFYKSYLFLSTRFRTSYLYPRPRLWRWAGNSRT